MTKDDIIALPNPLLRKKSQKISPQDPLVAKLAEQMISATLDWEDSRKNEFGAALAAVQIGKPKRVVVVRNDFDDKNNRSFSVYVNPEIVKQFGEPTAELEGCLSVRDIYGSVNRYPKVAVKAQDLKGKEIRIIATGFLARVFQHEIDHTNGVLFTDRIESETDLFKIQPNGSFLNLRGESAANQSELKGQA